MLVFFLSFILYYYCRRQRGFQLLHFAVINTFSIFSLDNSRRSFPMKNDKSLKTKWDGRILCLYFDLIENTRMLNQEGLFCINAIAICYCVGVEKNAYTFSVLGLNKGFFLFFWWNDPASSFMYRNGKNTSLAYVVFCGIFFPSW